MHPSTFNHAAATGEAVVAKAAPSPRRPELLAPAGNWDCARAAVENGADAIYFGLEKFNARMRAHNFCLDDLPALMEFLHLRGVRGYVTFNTLIFQTELAAAEQHLQKMIAAGVDAAIVQDVGICRLIRRLSPDFPIHASTQLTVTSAAGVRFARDLGCQLVVLARECSLQDIARIQAATAPERTAGATEAQSAPAGLPLEVFVHGALCVAYSGQCLTSEALGGRSANRGECAQACRMPYELIRDGQPVPLGERKYLLSPQDLAGVALVPELAQAGVASLKIEGRLKTPAYVASITRIYREALDRLAAAPLALEPAGGDEHDRYAMEMAFSRGLSTGWLKGINNQELVHARFGKKRGVFLGVVSQVQSQQVTVRLARLLKPGDGVVFDGGHPEAPEEGGRVYEVRPVGRRPGAAMSRRSHLPDPRPVAPESARDEVVLRFGRGDVNFARVHVGDKLWKTSDPELDRRVRQSYDGTQPKFRRPIHVEVRGRVGDPLLMMVRDEMGNETRIESAQPLVAAETRPLTADQLREQLGRLGGTPFRLGQLRCNLEGAAMLPVSELNRMRRSAVEELERRRRQPRPWTLARTHLDADTVRGAGMHAIRGGDTASAAGAAPAGVAQLIVLVRSLPQLEAALRCGVETLYCELEDPKRYREAVRFVRESAGDANPAPTIWVAPPRIHKTGEDWILKQVRSAEADGYLVRNYDHLEYFAGCRTVGDFSLNVANALAAAHFKERFGLERLTAAYDLNGAQLEALLQACPPDWFEVTIHQHMPMFHMEHCVFCAFLSQGTDYSNCGRPCDKHEVRLRDRVGAEHLLKADAGCRNTVFNAAAQTGAELVDRLRAAGLRHWRLEFVHESPEQLVQTLTRYRQLLRGELSGTQLWRELRLLNQIGVTRGSLEKA